MCSKNVTLLNVKKQHAIMISLYKYSVIPELSDTANQRETKKTTTK